MTRTCRLLCSVALLLGCLCAAGDPVQEAQAGSKTTKIVASFGREVLVEVAADGLTHAIKGFYKSVKQKWKKGIDPKKVIVDADDPLRGTLRGNVTVRAEQDGKTTTEVVLQNPPVSRATTKGKWQLDPKALTDWEELLNKKPK
jgi:hypothetical protein